MNNEPLLNARRIVIKLGTQVVIDVVEGFGEMLSRDRLYRLVSQCAKLAQDGREVLIVSSGAVGLGRQKLGLHGDLTLTEKQACAAVGQNMLMDAYQSLFQEHGLITGQVLLSAMDFAERQHYLNLQQTLETLLSLKVIPIINENDSVSTMQLQEVDYIKGFDDNDKLSALVAAKLDADLLVILTNVEGIYTDNPNLCPDAELVDEVQSMKELKQIQTVGQSGMGRGGMTSKLEAAQRAAISGVHTYIASGLQTQPLAPLWDKNAEAPGTLIHPQASISGKKRWIGMASGYQGTIVINDGACSALKKEHASLLAVGIVSVDGDFFANQVISIRDERGNEVGRGLSAYSSEEILKIKGCRSEAIDDRLNRPDDSHGGRYEVVHRDNIVIFEEYGI